MLLNTETQGLKPVFEIFAQFLHDVVIGFCFPRHLYLVTRLTVSIEAFKNSVHGFDAGAVDIDHGHFNLEFALGCYGQLVDGRNDVTIKADTSSGKDSPLILSFKGSCVSEMAGVRSVASNFIVVPLLSFLNGGSQNEIDTAVIHINKGKTDGLSRPARNLEQTQS